MSRIRHHHAEASSTMAHRLSMLFAMIGLLCAGIAASLILKLANPPQNTIIDYYSFEDAEDSLEEVFDSIDIEELVVETTLDGSLQSLRGRRLAEIVGGDVVNTEAPITMPSSPPSSFPTYIVIHDQDPDPTLPNNDEDDGPSVVATETIPAIIVGLASSIVVCSLLLYASDLKDRYKHEQWVQRQQEELNGPLDDDNSSQKSMQHSMTTSAASTDAESGYYITARLNHEIVEYRGADNSKNNMLPPMMLTDGREYNQTELPAIEAAPHDNDDDRSISRVSTLTTSLVEGGYGGYMSYADIEEKMSRYAIESSSEVTELSDNYRVADQMSLKELVAKAAKEGHPSDEDDSTVAESNDASVCSSLTNGSTTPNGSPKLLGEHCLERKGTSSLEVSPDTPQVDETTEEREEDGNEVAKKPHTRRMQENDNELSQLEQLVARIPFVNKFGAVSSPQAAAASTNDDAEREGPEDEAPVVPTAATDGSEEESYVRDIYFVPFTEEGSPSLGLELSDTQSPEAWTRVVKVEDFSPLVGRIFVGDWILSVNDIDTVGRSSKDVLELLEKTHAHVDGFDESSVASSRMTKLTVMSAESDSGSLSDGQQSFDLGQPESGVEL